MLEAVVNIAAAAVLLPGFTVVAFVFLVGSLGGLYGHFGGSCDDR
jgi:hypothetical protein